MHWRFRRVTWNTLIMEGEIATAFICKHAINLFLMDRQRNRNNRCVHNRGFVLTSDHHGWPCISSFTWCVCNINSRNAGLSSSQKQWPSRIHHEIGSMRQINRLSHHHYHDCYPDAVVLHVHLFHWHGSWAGYVKVISCTYYVRIKP